MKINSKDLVNFVWGALCVYFTGYINSRIGNTAESSPILLPIIIGIFGTFVYWIIWLVVALHDLWKED